MPIISSSPKTNVNVNLNFITGLKRALSSQDFASVVNVKKNAKEANIKSFGKNLNQLGQENAHALLDPQTDAEIFTFPTNNNNYHNDDNKNNSNSNSSSNHGKISSANIPAKLDFRNPNGGTTVDGNFDTTSEAPEITETLNTSSTTTTTTTLSTTAREAKSPTTFLTGNGNENGNGNGSVDNQTPSLLPSPVQVSSSSQCASCGQGGIDILIRPCNHLFHRSCLHEVLTKLASGVPVCCPLCGEGPVTSYVFALPVVMTQVSNEEIHQIPLGISEVDENETTPSTSSVSISTASNDSNDLNDQEQEKNENKVKNNKGEKGDTTINKISKHVKNMSIDRASLDLDKLKSGMQGP
jgi:type II secretory pathway pseudopilin PulG